MRMIIDVRPDPRMESLASVNDFANPLAARGRSGSRKQKHARARSRRAHDPGFNTCQWSARMYWKDITAAEVRTSLREVQEDDDVAATSNLALQLQASEHEQQQFAAATCLQEYRQEQEAAPESCAPRSSFVLSSLIESKLQEHQLNKLDTQIAHEWEVVDGRAVEEEEYVML